MAYDYTPQGLATVAMTATDRPVRRKASAHRRFFPAARLAPLAAIGVCLALLFALDLDRYLTFEALSRHRAELTGWIAANEARAAIAYIAVYAAIIALMFVPGGALLTIAGGFLFGPFAATLYAVIAATLGAAVAFLAARHAFAEALHRRAAPRLARMERGFHEDAFNYLLVLRLVPVFPFWLINLVPAFLGVRLSVFVAATFLGIVPGTFVFALVGDGLGAVFDRGEAPDVRIILEPRFLAPLLGLALLALMPVFYKRWRRRPK
jgi:uncharacterized membrane protein YdjX (TVP38/TMEM64 family)